MDVCGAEDYRERDASLVCHNMALRAHFSLIRRIRAGSLSPLFADTLAESRETLSQSIRSASPRRSRSTRCSASHTPASCQSRKCRQHVEPDPQPISLGSISQGMCRSSRRRRCQRGPRDRRYEVCRLVVWVALWATAARSYPTIRPIPVLCSYPRA